MTLNTEDIRYECQLHPCNPLGNLLFDASREIDRLRGLLESQTQWTHNLENGDWIGIHAQGCRMVIYRNDEPKSWESDYVGQSGYGLVYGDDVEQVKRALEAMVPR